MSTEFTLILALATFGVIAAIPTILIPALFAPKRPTPIKLAPFESGQTPTGEAKVHLLMQYYSYLLMFAVLDVIAMFLFAWGGAYFGLGVNSFLTVMMFLGIMFIPIAYALKLADKGGIW